LFTPHWIVRYLVENSLGRLWLLNRPNSRLAGQMDYYIAAQEPVTDFLRIARPEDIKLCDPACGSGNFLVIAYRQMREIERRIIIRLQGGKGSDDELTNLVSYDGELSVIPLTNFYGIDINMFAAESARLAAVLPSPKRYSVRAPGSYVQRRAAWIARQARNLDGPQYLAACCGVPGVDPAKPER
jgi:type II restriction/modification system DNA methylase subunit YeeA